MAAETFLLQDLLLDTRDGDWGEELATADHTPYRVIRGTDFPLVRYGDLSSVPVRHISQSSGSRRTLQINDILIETAGGSRDRPTGRTVLITDRLLAGSDLPCTCASFCRFLRVNPALADPIYVYWYLQHLYSSGEMWQHQVQHTGIARFQYTRFAATIEIPIPSVPEQRAIACILGSLDDKVELNRRMNETLEEMARALFKSWFVDFDPVLAKAEGRPPAGMDAESASHMPAEFEDSSLGKIPVGWKVAKIGEIAVFAYGRALKEEVRQLGPVPVYGSNGQVGWHDVALVEGPGIVVGRKGNPGTITWVNDDFYPIDTTFYVIQREAIENMYYLYHALGGLDLPSLGADSAVPGLSRNIAYMTDILVPPAGLQQAFGEITSPGLMCIHGNNVESRTLRFLRDALLPKLLSGEIRVKDAENVVKAAV
jgi:type I restriction enzyme, S subunit